MKILIVTLFWFSLVNFSWASKDPVALFVRDFVQNLEAQGYLRDHWGSGSTNFNPYGGYIFRFDYDVTADGRKEAFIASSIFAFFREGENWFIYSPSASGDYQLITRNLTFHPEVIKITQESSGETVLRTQDGDRDSDPSLQAYRFFANGTILNESRPFTPKELEMIYEDIHNETDKNHEALFLKPFTPLKVKKILMADYVKQKTPKWKDIDDSHNYEQQYLDPADREDLERAYADGVSVIEALQAIIPKLDPKEIKQARRVADWKLRKGKELTEFESAVMGPDPRKGKSPEELSQQVSQKAESGKNKISFLASKKWVYFVGGFVVLLLVYWVFKIRNQSDA